MQYAITTLQTKTTPLGTFSYVKWEGYSDRHNIWIRNDAIEDHTQRNDSSENDMSNKENTAISNSKTEQAHVSPDCILNSIATHRKLNAYKDTSIKVSQFIGQDLNKNEISIWLRDNHYYVLTNYQKACHIADGVNNCIGNCTIDAEVKKTQRRGMKLNHLGYQFQTHQGTCGAAATLIALEMIRVMKQRLPIPDRIEPTPSLRRNITNQMHKTKGTEDRACNKAGERINLRDEQSKRCKFCNKFIIKRATLLKHEAVCKTKK